MDKFQLNLLKKMVHNNEKLTLLQIHTFADYFMKVWAVNNYNSTPSKLSMKFYRTLTPIATSDVIEVRRFKLHMQRYG